jgi:hypothetical protein
MHMIRAYTQGQVCPLLSFSYKQWSTVENLRRLLLRKSQRNINT